jgi:ubiquinone biosynthesis monooxygenase Coq7
MDLDPNHPSDLNRDEKIAQMIRVNQAGEYGAARIYDGQLAVLKNKPCADVILHMREQEEGHLQAFNQLMIKYRVRPTILSPVWHVVGYLLGAGTALLGEKAAMACTVAVEEVIDEHYASQEKTLASEKRAPEKALKKLIKQCREDEIAHRDISLQYGATEARGYPVISGAIKIGTRLAIWLSKRI